MGCHRAVAASVVPEAVPAVREAVTALCACATLMIESGVNTGMRIRYRPPESLGADRLADAVAGRHRFGPPVVVIDFGTATTFNVVGTDGDFIGGAIAPGVGTAATALAAAGARLTPVDLRADLPVPSIGRNTSQAMRGGVLHGYAGLASGLLAHIDRELGSAPTVVATGGHAGAMKPLVARISHVDPGLTLEGLRLLADLNP
jgi:type III pantothenate kinase